MLLEGKVAVVSGVGPGTGRALALALAREGANLALAARSAERLETVRQEVEALGRDAIAVPTDITAPEQCRALAEQTAQRFGRIDVLINNAAATGHGMPLETIDLDRLRVPIEVNMIGTVAMTQAVIPAMQEAGGGSIVMINSLETRRAMEGSAAYSSSKAGLMALTQTFALELGRYQIRVNSVVPSYIWGGPVRLYFNALAAERGVGWEEVRAEIEASIPLGRIATAEDVAEAALFFASDRSRAITGQSLDVNCGEHFH